MKAFVIALIGSAIAAESKYF